MILLRILVASLVAWLSLDSPAEASPSPDAPAAAYTYDAPVYNAPGTASASERGPSPACYDGTTRGAVDSWSHGTSARPGNTSHPAITTNAYPATFVRGTEGSTGTSSDVVLACRGLLSGPAGYVAADGVARLADSGVVNPSTIRFSQNNISGSFRGGGGVKDLAAGLKNGTVNPNGIPAIRLVERDGQYLSLENRRLAAFQEAGVDIPYRMATPSEIANEGWKFTTTNGGTSIVIRGGG